MFYKVNKDGKIIDVLNQLVYVRYQKRNNQMMICDADKAQAILSSDGKYIWHEISLYQIPVEAGLYDTVEIIPIDKYEYQRLKMLNGRTSEEIIDEYTLMLINNDTTPFVESLRRLYQGNLISDEVVAKFANENRITNDHRKYILEM